MKRLLALIVFFTGCLFSHPAAPPSADQLTRFLDHPEQIKPRRERFPFMLAWAADESNPERPWSRYQKISIPPVNLSYFEESETSARPEERKRVAEYAQAQFRKAIQNDGEKDWQLVEQGAPDALVAQIALIRLHSTARLENIAVDAAGFFIPGAVVLATAASAAGGAAIRELSSGDIAIALKVVDGNTGQLLGEFYDERGDRAALVNVEDYSSFGNAKLNIDDWAEEFQEILDTPKSEKVSGPSDFALLLW